MREKRSLIAGAPAADPAFAGDVGYYLSLTPRQLPSRYLYDGLGSALFEAICHLPWYRITRAELGLLERWGASMAAAAPPFTRLIELGPGSGAKIAAFIEAAGLEGRSFDVHLVDISPSALEVASYALGRFEGVRVVRHQATYETGLDAAVRAGGGPALALFLGSNIGNFDPPGADAFLRGVRAALRRGDGFLIGADLVKPEEALRAAYDDPLGVTAAFNRNLLLRINRELGGTFDLDGFRHHAAWNADASRIEMHLVSTRRQDVEVAKAGLAFTIEEGESIWTESSYKYEPDGIAGMLQDAGFRVLDQWVDERDGFALTLVEAR
jgi:L-histidine N-alpha-methyltransferase